MQINLDGGRRVTAAPSTCILEELDDIIHSKFCNAFQIDQILRACLSYRPKQGRNQKQRRQSSVKTGGAHVVGPGLKTWVLWVLKIQHTEAHT